MKYGVDEMTKLLADFDTISDEEYSQLLDKTKKRFKDTHINLENDFNITYTSSTGSSTKKFSSFNYEFNLFEETVEMYSIISFSVFEENTPKAA